jgi:AmmeMemoRadiSam system protein A
MSHPPHNSFPSSSSTEGDAPPSSSFGSSFEFSSQERAQLLQLAHHAITSALQGRELPLHPPNAHLSEPRGVFTTLHLRGGLRGCVGYVVPTSSLYQAVAETARAAALNDNRFPAVTREEAPLLEIELSVLSVPRAIAADAIEIGRHGLLITHRGRRGLLLPQVAAERNWTVTTFLEQTCLKAGLSADAWQKGATIEAFTAEIFGDKENRERDIVGHRR